MTAPEGAKEWGCEVPCTGARIRLAGSLGDDRTVVQAHIGASKSQGSPHSRGAARSPTEEEWEDFLLHGWGAPVEGDEPDRNDYSAFPCTICGDVLIQRASWGTEPWPDCSRCEKQDQSLLLDLLATGTENPFRFAEVMLHIQAPASDLTGLSRASIGCWSRIRAAREAPESHQLIEVYAKMDLWDILWFIRTCPPELSGYAEGLSRLVESWCPITWSAFSKLRRDPCKM